ncbi:MAG: tetratricopeptide repeat protein, partial [Rhodospirillales bacterium]|nr:tetratricopeptide repeat protein [Rhodospirillales bacterium]
LITDLSKLSALIVISRTSTFTYKGQTPDIRAVAKDLNVRYVVEGSVRKAGGKVRITAQLIDAETGGHIWAERYDREEKNIFDLQDEVRAKVIAALKVKLTPNEKARLARCLTASPEAYDLWLRGRRYESFFTKEANLTSRQLFEQAIKLDPNFAAAYASLGTAYFLANEIGSTGHEFRKIGLHHIEKAIALDSDLPQAQWALGRAMSRRATYDGDRAIAALEKAISLDPNYADAHAFLTAVKVDAGHTEGMLEKIKHAMRLNPHFPFWYFHTIGKIQFMMNQYEAAIKNFKKALERNPNATWIREWLVAAYGQAGRLDDAKWELEELRAQGRHEIKRSVRRKTINIQDAAYRKHYI